MKAALHTLHDLAILCALVPAFTICCLLLWLEDLGWRKERS